MTKRVKAYLLPLPSGSSPPRSVAAAREAVDRAMQSGTGELRTAVSAGAWLPLLSAELCRRWSIEGLGFLLDDLRTLSPSESRSAAAAVEQLLSKLEAGERPRDARELGAQWRLIISPADLGAVIAQTVPRSEVDEEDGEDWALIAFLVAVQVAATDAVEASMDLLFWCAPE